MVLLVLAEGIFFAFLSFFCWGITDFMCKMVIDRTGHFKLFFFLNLLSSIPLLIYALIFIQIPSIFPIAIIITASIGFFLTIGSISFFKGLEKGHVSIMSPVGSCWGIITVLLALVFLGEILIPNQIIAIFILFCGIVLTSISWSNLKASHKSKLMLGSKEAVFAMFFWGIAMFMLKFADENLGSIWAIVFVRYFTALFLFLYGKATYQKFSFSSKSLWLPIIVISLLDLVGFTSFIFGISTELVSIIAPIATSAPAFTCILAYIFLRERLERNQYFGVGMILTGLITISII